LPEPVKADYFHLSDGEELVLDALTKPECAALFPGGRTGPDGVDRITTILAGGAVFNGGVPANVADANTVGVFFADLGGVDASGNITAAATTGSLGRNSVGQSVFIGVSIRLNSNLQAPWLTGYPDRFDLQEVYGAQTQNVYRAITLLHELGHAFAMLFGAKSSSIVDDQGKLDVSQANTREVFRRCF
jgi:hypothetical protein